MTAFDLSVVPKDVFGICEKLAAFGRRGWVVGGCVRDSLLGKSVADWDVATDARPEELMKLYTLESNPDYGMKDWEQRYETVPQPFRCSNCGMGYVSLEDRMLRPPGIDGCGGCRLKSAHG